jgi:asparagine synthase (glutamine-hydrolysing)
MCGIAGIFASSLSADELHGALTRMANAMLHRGPDQGAVRLLPEIGGGLAVRRLALVDVAGGAQPIANESGDVLALLNGEIYNHEALRRELERQGHGFRTRCDTEVLVHLYEEHEDRFLARLEGMFGLAIFDLARRRLLVARDGPGIKPLYCAHTAAGFAFASEAKALFAAGIVQPHPDPVGLDICLATGFVPAPRTVFAGVEKLAAGTYAVLAADGEPERRTFWSFAYRADPEPLDERAAVDELERRLTAAVVSHLRADVPIGCLLSGGWDSSLVALLAARERSAPLETFSIVFPDAPDADESRFSRQMAAVLGSVHREIEFRPAMLPDLLPRYVRHLEEPISAVPEALVYVLASLAGAHVKGVIGGEGADELFGGYAWFRDPRPYWLRRVLPRPLAAAAHPFSRDERVRRWLRIVAASDLELADAEWRRHFLPSEKRALLRPELRSDGPDLAAVRIPAPLAASCSDSVQRRLALDLHGRLTDGILLAHDKVTMAHSLELRVPFLDRGVIELAERLPSRLKVHRGREKIVVRRLAERLLPAEIAARRKQGLAFPRRAWSGPEVGDRLRQMLLDGAERGPFDRAGLERTIARRSARRHGTDGWLTNLVMLQVWWNEFFQPAGDLRQCPP